MAGKFILVFLLFLVSGSFVLGGIRGPGKYSGVVIFDRWDTCYLYSGIYLMYIARAQKEILRPYRGRSVLIDATEVSQPINPGDGLITAFKVLGDAPVSTEIPSVEGLRLVLTEVRSHGPGVRFEVEIENQSSKTVGLSVSDLAPTLLGKKTGNDPFSPSDDSGVAKITRCNFSRRCGSISRGPNGEVASNGSSVEIEHGVLSAPDNFVLAGGQKMRFAFSVVVSRGDYDVIVGYGGGVHDGKGIASNMVSISVDKFGRRTDDNVEAHISLFIRNCDSVSGLRPPYGLSFCQTP